MKNGTSAIFAALIVSVVGVLFWVNWGNTGKVEAKHDTLQKCFDGHVLGDSMFRAELRFFFRQQYLIDSLSNPANLLRRVQSILERDSILNRRDTVR